MFPDLKRLIKKYSSTETNSKREIVVQPILFSRDDAINYPKYWEKDPKWDKTLKQHQFQ